MLNLRRVLGEIPRTFCDGGSAGASATISREPGQARKGAAVAVDLGAGVSLAGHPQYQIPPHTEPLHLRFLLLLRFSTPVIEYDANAGRRPV